MNDTDVTRESELILRRLSDGFPFAPASASNALWFVTVGAVLLLGVLYVGFMYYKDSRTCRWFFALPLGVLRVALYLLLAFAFFLPAYQTWERTEKRSKVLIVLDVSPSVTAVTDDISQQSGVKTKTRMQKVLDFLTDEKVAFVQKILEKNPVAVYRFGTRLEEEPTEMKSGSPAWTRDEWDAFARYDFKPIALKGLSPAAQTALKASAGWDGDKPGTADWAVAWSNTKEEIDVKDVISAKEVNDIKEKLGKRVDVAKSIMAGTNVADSLRAAIDREASNMVQGIVVFTDGRSNLGSESAFKDLTDKAGKEKIPLFTVAVGEPRENVNITITEIQAPDRAPPDEPFKVIVEADGTGLEKQEVEVRLGLYLPGRDPKVDAPDHEVVGKLTFQPGEPPHGMAEFLIDPDKLPETLTEESKKLGKRRQLKQGAWATVAKIARDKREVFPDADHVSPPRVIQVIDRPLRVLLFASAGGIIEYQTLRTLFVREVTQKRAELSICIQSEGGRDGSAVQDLDDPNRLLTRFPDRLDTSGKAPAKPEDKFYNLNEYDLIIAFDPDWSELSADTVKNIQAWVDNLGGGLILVAGPIHTFQLARASEDGRLKPMLDILPVIPDDVVLAGTRGVPRIPRRLKFDPKPTYDVLRLEEGKPDDPVAGWEMFFTDREKLAQGENPKALVSPRRGFYSYYPVKMVKPSADVLASFIDVTERGEPDAKPWLVTGQSPRGRTAFIGSDLRRLSHYSIDYFQRFWIKLARYVSANRDLKASRGRVLLSKEYVSGSPVRVQARLLDPKGQPYEESKLNPKFKVVAYAADGTPLNKQFGPFEMKVKKGGSGFDGYYAGQLIADPRTLPPGDFKYKVVVDVPDSPGDTIEGEFMVKRSDPELDNTRPDYQALVTAASTLEDVKGGIKDPTVFERLKGSEKDPTKVKLAFKLAETEKLMLIPACLDAKQQTLKSRGPVEDLWDKPLKFQAGGQDVVILDVPVTNTSLFNGLALLCGYFAALMGAYVGFRFLTAALKVENSSWETPAVGGIVLFWVLLSVIFGAFVARAVPPTSGWVMVPFVLMVGAMVFTNLRMDWIPGLAFPGAALALTAVALVGVWVADVRGASMAGDFAVGGLLLAAVAILSLEWTGRKLLRLA